MLENMECELCPECTFEVGNHHKGLGSGGLEQTLAHLIERWRVEKPLVHL
jgi:hypothetical protein